MGTNDYTFERPFADAGIPCPACGDTHSGVLDSRPSPPSRGTAGQPTIRRRRICKNGHRYTTREQAEELHWEPTCEI